MRFLAVVVLGVLAVAAGIKIIGVQKNIHYKVDLLVRGEPVTVDRVVHCSPYLGGEISNPFDIYYRADRAALTKRLANGEGLIVVLPNYCFSTLPVPRDFIPLTALVDDADAPQRMELYISGVRLTSPGSTVQLVDFEAEIVGLRLGGFDYADEFAAWEVLGSLVAPVHNPVEFLALYGLASEQAIPDPGPALVRSGDVGREWLLRHPHYHVQPLMDGSFDDPPMALGRSRVVDPGYDIVPFVRGKAGTLIAAPDNRGTIVFYKRDASARGPWRPHISAEGMTFEVGDRLDYVLQLRDAQMSLSLEIGVQRLSVFH
ncbi:hypothetical protein [Dongia sedimenti]|uniref:Uncharacterized protein n=1 Tax=Dongia sedimenti TaxID=3064282 RepID=A0ABU0YRT8_9PROT|nr:hypothetical protein [Rhodospirillaceae bacterium R-7]